MSLENTQFIGSFVTVSLALISGYLLLIKLRESFKERPDPKITYATIAEVDKLRELVLQQQRDTKADFTSAHALIHKNAEHLARLIAQSENVMQRIQELSVKTDRMQLKQ
ncbi:hypothetical protein [Rubellicoccus peritrichatus]|uniref:Uncharacterized protein n=1 Tax=Rubellicoccus peritrichatus TaxID=3080537 RepID=A0AAQ3L7Q7_9BACT|nr:hypothetical protein [Puniceicoccus sp. CR14]WOO41174.1 hypothetical protein RZN69_21345 [Puniceicoccus sp. CR14]